SEMDGIAPVSRCQELDALRPAGEAAPAPQVPARQQVGQAVSPALSRVRKYLALTGKNGREDSAVFGVSPHPRAEAGRYLRRGAPEAPVWLFSQSMPDPDTAALCEHVTVLDDSMALLIEAQKQLWPNWVGLAVATWTGERGRWPLKLAPFFIPPF